MKTLRLTKPVLNRLDPSHISMSLREDDSRASITLNIALSTVAGYLAEAAVQQRRIVHEQEAIGEYIRQMRLDERAGHDRPLLRRRRHRPNAFRSVHFYLTCWRMIRRHLDLVSRTCGLPEVRAAVASHRDTLEQYAEMRDHHEHFDERLPGQRNVHRLAVPGDLGNFVGYTLTFGGKTVDVGPDSLALLRAIVSEVLLAFKLGAIRKLSVENPRALKAWFLPLHVRHLAARGESRPY